jgi:hypothetical protein
MTSDGLLSICCSSSFCSRWAGIVCDPVFAFLFRFQGGPLPCNLNSLMGLRRVIGFLFSFFLVINLEVIISKLFMYLS